MRGLEKLDLSFSEPSMDEPHVAPGLSNLRPLGQAFREGAFMNLQELDLSFQVNVSSLLPLLLSCFEVSHPAFPPLATPAALKCRPRSTRQGLVRSTSRKLS